VNQPGPAGEPTSSEGLSIDTDPHVRPRRYITAEIPGTGGRIKERPEDFLVDEIPAYQPCGEGEHVYLFIEKRNFSTPEVARALASHFGVDREAVSYAGMKDRVAITRQVFSVHAPGVTLDRVPKIEHERFNVQWVDLHTNKLRLGHLEGNRFSIRIRGVGLEAVRHARRALEELEGKGVANRFGPQRFGRALCNHLIGRALVLGRFEEAVQLLLAPDSVADGPHAQAKAMFLEGRFEDAMGALPHTSRPERAVLRALARGDKPARAMKTLERPTLRFFVSAFQSAVFNRVLDERVARGTLGTLLEGDVAFKHDKRVCFDVDSAVATDPQTAERLAKLEISPSGPMWGAEMRRAHGDVASLESSSLAALGVGLTDLEAFEKTAGQLIEGARRPLRVALKFPGLEAGADEHGPYVRVAFDLPRGSFATVVLEEIMKTGAEAQGADADHGDA
jgi:tRNA pseudouridine13 synthase